MLYTHGHALQESVLFRLYTMPCQSLFCSLPAEEKAVKHNNYKKCYNIIQSSISLLFLTIIIMTLLSTIDVPYTAGMPIYAQLMTEHTCT